MNNAEQPVVNRMTLVERRARRGWNQAEMARRAGVSQGHLSEIERGVTAPRPGTLAKLASALSTEVADLVFVDLAAVLDTASELIDKGGSFGVDSLPAARRLQAKLDAVETRLSHTSNGAPANTTNRTEAETRGGRP